MRMPLVSKFLCLTHPQKMRIRQNFKKNASNAREVTGVVFFESPCDLQALGAASRCTSHVSLNIPVSLIYNACSIFSLHSTHPMFIMLKKIKNKAATTICCQNVMALSRNISMMDTS